MNQTTFVCFVLGSLLLHSCTSAPEKQSPGTKVRTSVDGLIPADTANLMIRSYLASLPDNEPGAVPDLKSWIIDADMLRAYLENNAIQKVKLMPAHTLSYIEDGHYGTYAGYKSNALTLVIAGYDSDGNYIFATGNRVPNHAMPCPSNCPSAGTAAKDTLQ